ncbi:unnamed protein product [Cuscuta europaea]|uniref:Ubiquitin-like protease family profile domain-containing protein n=1 Tax=Cuscuta europaea TaxID=41803 RepID=A0A9P0ZMD6_CUSEU|nr:unnamed protein product [Cuscuta europaea]
MHRKEIVFKYKDYNVTREDLMTIKVGCKINEHVLNVWVTTLNYREKNRSSFSPSRFFAKTMNCLYTMADEVIKTKEEAYNILTDAVEFELDVVRQEVELDKIDLFFFPIMQMRHYYVICINIKRKRIDILDNSSARVSNRDKYEEMPATVVSAFV